MSAAEKLVPDHDEWRKIVEGAILQPLIQEEYDNLRGIVVAFAEAAWSACAEKAAGVAELHEKKPLLNLRYDEAARHIASAIRAVGTDDG